MEIRLTRLVGIYYRQGSSDNHQALFTAEVSKGEVKPDGNESLKVEWFPLNHLPERLMSIHRLSIADALQGGPAVVRSLKVYPTFSNLTRQEMYSLRDQGKLDLQAVLAELCSPLGADNIKTELE